MKFLLEEKTFKIGHKYLISDKPWIWEKTILGKECDKRFLHLYVSFKWVMSIYKQPTIYWASTLNYALEMVLQCLLNYPQHPDRHVSYRWYWIFCWALDSVYLLINKLNLTTKVLFNEASLYPEMISAGAFILSLYPFFLNHTA